MHLSLNHTYHTYLPRGRRVGRVLRGLLGTRGSGSHLRRPLCTVCQPGYGRHHGFGCRRCPGAGALRLVSLGVAALVIGVALLLVFSAWRQNAAVARGAALPGTEVRGGQAGTLLKLFVTYAQIQAMAVDLDLYWPGPFVNLLSAQAAMSVSIESVASLDCMLGLVAPAPFHDQAYPLSPLLAPYGKLVAALCLVPLALLLPALFLPFVAAWWRLRRGRGRGRGRGRPRRGGAGEAGEAGPEPGPEPEPEPPRPILPDLVDLYVVAAIVCLFLVHPVATRQILRIFACARLGGRTVLVQDMSVACWTAEHWRWALGAGVPGVLLVALGIPALALALLHWNRVKLFGPQADPRAVRRYAFLYAVRPLDSQKGASAA
eukprot:tig00000760_g3934.t1